MTNWTERKVWVTMFTKVYTKLKDISFWIQSYLSVWFGFLLSFRAIRVKYSIEYYEDDVYWIYLAGNHHGTTETKSVHTVTLTSVTSRITAGWGSSPSFRIVTSMSGIAHPPSVSSPPPEPEEQAKKISTSEKTFNQKPQTNLSLIAQVNDQWQKVGQSVEMLTDCRRCRIQSSSSRCHRLPTRGARKVWWNTWCHRRPSRGSWEIRAWSSCKDEELVRRSTDGIREG